MFKKLLPRHTARNSKPICIGWSVIEVLRRFYYMAREFIPTSLIKIKQSSQNTKSYCYCQMVIKYVRAQYTRPQFHHRGICKSLNRGECKTQIPYLSNYHLNY